MNKRSALFVAGGLVVTMLIAASAILMGVTGPSPARANVVPPRHKQKPIVKTIKRTVTVHEPALAPSTFTNIPSTTTRSADAEHDPSGGSHHGPGGTNPPPGPMPGSGGEGEDDGSPSGSPSPSGGPSWGGDD